MKKTLLLCSLSLALSSASQLSFALTPPLSIYTSPTNNQALVDDWVNYKLAEKQFDDSNHDAQQRLQNTIFDMKDDKVLKQYITTESKKSAQAYTHLLSMLKPQTTEIKKLIELKQQLIRDSLDLMVNEMLSEERLEDDKQQRHELKFKQVIELTTQVQEFEYDLEYQVLKILKQQQSATSPLKP
ncbi:hypothetical protein EC844_11032 [Acinetobacter calcoaceticus]|uniref:Uncharacterized protein n=1 Tax=Acinetobacter calcoaceticus TaxID=471 RepID=A0A4R1XV31_ACICA|nr:hypothetical protein EC844_11032 [Acinetobacter calcoaceticus]